MVLALGATSAGVAQPSPPSEVFRTTLRLVQLSLIARDKAGAPILDLTKSDLALTEDGQPQQISVFSLERGEERGVPARSLPAGFFSNRPEYRGAAPRSATVILIDLLNTPPGYYGRARDRLAAFLRQIEPRLSVAIYTLGRRGLRVLHDFTTDSELLRKPLREIREPLPLEVPRDIMEALIAWGNLSDAVAELVARDRLETDFRREHAILDTLEALTAIARRLSAVPGRKNLVWLSTGFPLAMGFDEAPYGIPVRNATFTSQFQGAVCALNDASVAVYPVDARGLLALAEAAEFLRGRRVQFGPALITPQTSTMQQLADRTGGKRFLGAEIDRALPEVFEHARVSYTLAYYPSNQNYDGKFRRIQVKARRPGVRLSYRAGYYAVGDVGSAEQQRKADLLSAVWSPMDATAVAFDAALERTPGMAQDERTLVIHVDGGALVFQPRAEGLGCRFGMLVVQKDSEGRQLEGALDNLEINTAAERARVLQQQGLTHRTVLRLHPQAAIIRVVVRNDATGALGSLGIPLGLR